MLIEELPDLKAFARTINNNRRDWAPKLVFADWCRENNLHEVADIIHQFHEEHLNRVDYACSCFMYGCGELWGIDETNGCKQHKNYCRKLRHENVIFSILGIGISL